MKPNSLILLGYAMLTQPTFWVLAYKLVEGHNQSFRSALPLTYKPAPTWRTPAYVNTLSNPTCSKYNDRSGRVVQATVCHDRPVLLLFFLSLPNQALAFFQLPVAQFVFLTFKRIGGRFEL